MEIGHGIGTIILCGIGNALTLHNLDRAAGSERRNKKPEKFGTPRPWRHFVYKKSYKTNELFSIKTTSCGKQCFGIDYCYLNP
jgi:hypothetical protein